MKVLAVDSGRPQMTGSVLVKLSVADINDNPPFFSQHNYSAVVQVRGACAAHVGCALCLLLFKLMNGKLAGCVAHFCSGEISPIQLLQMSPEGLPHKRTCVLGKNSSLV